MNEEKAKMAGGGRLAKAAMAGRGRSGEGEGRCWYECSLPKPPLPDPSHTFQRYMEFVRVLADGTNPSGVNSEKTERCVRKFEPVAKKLQAMLTKLAEESDNWINEFWLSEMYLRQRMPLPVNFNPAYVFPRQHFQTEQDWIDYAAWIVRALLDFKEGVDKKLTTRETFSDRFCEGKTAQLCMDQYDRVLNCYREPAFGEDILHNRRGGAAPKEVHGTAPKEVHGTAPKEVHGTAPKEVHGTAPKEVHGTAPKEVHGTAPKEVHGTAPKEVHGTAPKEVHGTAPKEVHGMAPNITACNGSDVDRVGEGKDEHIVVIIEQQQFVLVTRPRGIPTTAPTIARQLAKIRAMARNRIGETVHPVGGASTGHRDRAAAFWEEMKKIPVNRRSLEAIRSAVFVLCLDDLEDDLSPSNGDRLRCLESDGLQILHGFGSGRNGLNRWFDCTIQLIVSRNGCCGLCIEHSVAEGIVIINMAEGAMRFANENWILSKKMETDKSKLEQGKENDIMPVQIPAPKCLSWALNENAIHLLREQVAEFDKLVQDSWGVSPDGFVQLAMQFAHFKLHGYLVSTYESATMRRFRYGRVDNIRAATPEALAWVKAMAEGGGAEGHEKKRALFLQAVRKQAMITRENVTGNGIDNHLCALEVLSRSEEDSKELFEDLAWRELMRFPLSTSQVSTSSEFVGCFLFYGPVVRDGYGCAYNIQQDKIIFAITAWKSEEKTELEKFRDCLANAVGEMGNLLESGQRKTARSERVDNERL
uniref:Choline O-acetyltransferase n=1 Tax=Globodera rostochiensis TaxID=31243 RepID=A0A914GVM3_GLORO